MSFIQKIQKWVPFYSSLRFLKNRLLLLVWMLKGRPVPPPKRYKQNCVLNYRKLNDLHILVETGTFLGEMIRATYSKFDDIYSIELDDFLYQKACDLFSSYQNVHLIHGDSGTILTDLLEQISQPCLFWLDAHYSGNGTGRGIYETPIMLELASILAHPIKSHVILIDDARHFDGNGFYPTLKEVEQILKDRADNYKFVVENDIIRISPQNVIV